MQIHNPQQASGITVQSARRPRLWMTFTVSGLLIAGCAVLVGQPGNAQSEQFGDTGSSSQPRCSNRTLRGSYALNIDGTIIAGPNRLLLRGVAMRQFDGNGNLSQVDFTTINGAPAVTDWRSGSGTYELNSDCTGTMEIIQSDGSPTLRLRLVVGDHGRTTYDISEGNSTGATGTKVDEAVQVLERVKAGAWHVPCPAVARHLRSLIWDSHSAGNKRFSLPRLTKWAFSSQTRASPSTPPRILNTQQEIPWSRRSSS